MKNEQIKTDFTCMVSVSVKFIYISDGFGFESNIVDLI